MANPDQGPQPQNIESIDNLREALDQRQVELDRAIAENVEGNRKKRIDRLTKEIEDLKRELSNLGGGITPPALVQEPVLVAGAPQPDLLTNPALSADKQDILNKQQEHIRQLEALRQQANQVGGGLQQLANRGTGTAAPVAEAPAGVPLVDESNPFRQNAFEVSGTPAPETLRDQDPDTTIIEPGEGKDKKHPLEEKWNKLEQFREEYKIATDEGHKEGLLEAWEDLYKEVAELYEQQTGNELREDIQEKAVEKRGVRFVKPENARKELMDKMEKRLQAERSKVEEEIKGRLVDNVIQSNWEALDKREKAEYVKKGEIIPKLAPDKYKQDLSVQLARANKELRKNVDDEGNIIELTPVVFHALIREGYNPQSLKGRILSKGEGRALGMGFGGALGVGGAAASLIFGPVGMVFGGTATALGFAGEKIFSKRLYGGVKMSHRDDRSKSMSQEKFEDLVEGVRIRYEEFVNKKVQEEMEQRRADGLVEVETKLMEAEERAKNVKQDIAGKLIRKVSRGKGAEAQTEPESSEQDDVAKSAEAVAKTKKIIKEFFEKNEPTQENLKTLKKILEDKEKSPLYLIKPEKLREAIAKKAAAEVNKIVKVWREKENQESLEEARLELGKKGVLFPKDFYSELVALGYEPQNINLEKGVVGLGSAAQRKLLIPHKDGGYYEIQKEDLRSEEKVKKAIVQLKKRSGISGAVSNKGKSKKGKSAPPRKPFGFAEYSEMKSRLKK